MRIVIASDKFKGSLSATEVGASLADGIRRVHPRARVEVVPMADGGEGTVDAAVANGFARRDVRVSGPLGAPVNAAFAIRKGQAVIELAAASGLLIVPEGDRDALRASSRGTGELIAEALREGATEIILAIGGSASTDGGAGMLAALGVRFVDAEGREIADGGGGLADLDHVDLSGLDPRLARTRFILASDVDHVLLGERGAARVFGPQKGADAAQITALDLGLQRIASALSDALRARGVADDTDHAATPGSRAAGGVGFAALAVLGAERQPGAAVVADVTDLAARVTGADLVITGEGSFDQQTLGGKTAVGVLSVGRAAGLPVVMTCGRSLLEEAVWREAGFAACYALADYAGDPATSIREAAHLLGVVGQDIAEQHLNGRH